MFDVSVVAPECVGGETLEEGFTLAAEAGADAVELYGLADREPTAVRKLAEENGLAVAAIVAQGDTPGIENVTPSISDPASIERSIADLEASIEIARELGGAGVIVTVGQRRDQLARDEQYRAIVDVLRAVAPQAEAAGITVLPEPLNRRVDHPGYLLDRSDEAFRLVHAVDSTAVKVLYDVYHQQITEGNIIATLRRRIHDIGHLHIADVPGRHEPGTGELDYDAIFDALAGLEYDGFVGCEFWNEGEQFEATQRTIDRIRSR